MDMIPEEGLAIHPELGRNKVQGFCQIQTIELDRYESDMQLGERRRGMEKQ